MHQFFQFSLYSLLIAMPLGANDTPYMQYREEADARLPQDKSKSELHNAVLAGELERVKELLASGANIEVQDSSGATPLHSVAQTKNIEIAKLLLEKGAKIDARDHQAKTVLHHASLYGQTEMTEFLISQGADVKAVDSYGETALHLSYHHAKPALVKLLLKHGADVNARNSFNATALHMIAEMGLAETAELLMDKGIDIYAQDGDGKSALYYAELNSRDQMVKLLLRHGIGHALKDQNIKYLTEARPKTDAKIYFIYKSHSACPPCRVVTKKFCEQYETLGKDIEIILLNGDPTAEKGENWVRGAGVKYAVCAPNAYPSIPMPPTGSAPNLIVLDADCKVLAAGYGPAFVLAEFEKAQDYLKAYKKAKE